MRHTRAALGLPDRARVSRNNTEGGVRHTRAALTLPDRARVSRNNTEGRMTHHRAAWAARKAEEAR